MTLADIRREAAAAPTMMELKQEMQIIQKLMDMPFTVLNENILDFHAIMNRLTESHLQAFFDIDDNSRPLFIAFSKWLEKLSMTVPPGNERLARQGYAEHFSTDWQRM